MAIISELQKTKERFSKYIERFISLCRERGISGSGALPKLIEALRDPVFRSRWNSIWDDIASNEGGKLGLSTVLLIIGLVLGGVGIAAGGGAVGLPLAVLLAPFGYLFGQELDSEGVTKRTLRKFKEFLGFAPVSTRQDGENGSGLNEAIDAAMALAGETSIRCDALQTEMGAIRAQVRNLNLDSLERRCDDLQRQNAALVDDLATARTVYDSRLRAMEEAVSALKSDMKRITSVETVLIGLKRQFYRVVVGTVVTFVGTGVLLAYILLRR